MDGIDGTKFGTGLTIVLLAAVALAGCAAPDADESGCKINRIIDLAFSSKDTEDVDDIYDVASATLRVTVRAPGSPGDFSVRYKTEAGENETRPLSDFVEERGSGDLVVRIPDTAIDSPGVVSKDGEALCSRTGPSQPWWKIQDLPTGVLMGAGAELGYGIQTGGETGMSLTDLTVEEDGNTTTIDRARMNVRVDTAGSVGLTAADSAAPVQTMEGEIDAHEVDWSLDTQTSFPTIFEIEGTHNGSQVEAGVEVKETVGDMSAAGTLHVAEEDRRIVRFATESGSMKLDAKIIAWSSDEDTDLGGCEGTSREDECTPDNVPDVFPMQEDIPKTQQDLTVLPPSSTPPEARQAIDAFLSEQLAVGDEIRAEITARGADLQDLPTGDQPTVPPPEDLEVDISWSLKATKEEQKTVAAGTFPTIVLAQEATFRFETQGSEETGLGPVHLDETLSSSTIWLHRDDGYLVQLERDRPLDFNRLWDEFVDAAPDAAFEDTNLTREDLKKLDFSMDSRTTVELETLSGTVRMAPWVVLMTTSGVAASPMAAAFGSAAPGSGGGPS